MFTRLGLPMNRYFRKPKLFRSLSIGANADFQFILQYSHSRTSRTIRIFCKDLHETLKYVDQFSELKKNDEIKKEHTHNSLSVSLLVNPPMHFDFPERMCMHQSLSLSFSLFTFAIMVWIKIRPEWNPGKNVSSMR